MIYRCLILGLLLGLSGSAARKETGTWVWTRFVRPGIKPGTRVAGGPECRPRSAAVGAEAPRACRPGSALRHARDEPGSVRNAALRIVAHTPMLCPRSTERPEGQTSRIVPAMGGKLTVMIPMRDGT